MHCSSLRLPWETELPLNFPLYWTYIFYHSGFWATCAWPKEQSCPEIFTVLNIYFLSCRIFEQLALALKIEFPLNIFTVLNIHFLSFRMFEQLALALKTELPWNFSLYWIHIFCHSGFLSNLRLPCKQSLPWIHCIEYILFIIQDIWTTCACPENRVCPEIFQDRGAATPPTPRLVRQWFVNVVFAGPVKCSANVLSYTLVLNKSEIFGILFQSKIFFQ